MTEKNGLHRNSLISRAEDDQLDTLWSSRALPADHQTFIPPSTTISTPVTYELSSEARNKATFATSSGRPRRPSSVLPSIAVAHSGSFSCCRVWLVSIKPGEMEFARIPCSRPSIASCRVIPMIPALAVVCASEPSLLKLMRPLSDAVFTTTPWLAFRYGHAARVRKKPGLFLPADRGSIPRW